MLWLNSCWLDIDIYISKKYIDIKLFRYNTYTLFVITIKKTKFKDYADVKHTYENDLNETYRNNKDLVTTTASYEKLTDKVFCVVENAFFKKSVS